MKKIYQTIVMCILLLICTPAVFLIRFCSIIASFLIGTPDKNLPKWLYDWGELLNSCMD